MAHFNGSKYLEEQLQTIDQQEGVEVELVVVDDCSDVNELRFLKRQIKLLKIKTRLIENSFNQGVAITFLGSLQKLLGNFDYYAFADQDDVWSENKLSIAIEKIGKARTDEPTLYCSRTRIIWSDGTLGPLSQKRKSPSFRNALAQSLAGGNTMVFCPKAARLIAKSFRKHLQYSGHDWWCYILITGAGGKIVYDPEPHIFYRQHANNLIGENNSLLSKFKRLRLLFKGTFKVWNDQNINAIRCSKPLFTPENLEIVEAFDDARGKGVFCRLRAFVKLRLFRHSLLSNCGLLVGWLFGRV